ncbi:hypothetical protein PspLS_10886 [Pyricularia sp. CBS 133598]|nr:hypothetical protein PspLS_10886 [Pyricularia sp. CBS 133598]
MATLENNAEAVQPNGSGSPLHRQNEKNVENIDSPSNEAKRQGDEELSQDGPAAKRARTGDVDDQPFLVNADFELQEGFPEDVFRTVVYVDDESTEQPKTQPNGPTEAQSEGTGYYDDDLVEVLPEDIMPGTFPSPVQAVKLEISPTQPRNYATEIAGDDDDVVIIDNPVASHVASSVHSRPVESIQPVQDVAVSPQQTLNYAMAKDALGALADCTAIRFVLLHALNIVHPHSWEKARDILTKVPPARDDYDIFKRLLFTWYTDRTDPTVEAEDEIPDEEAAEEEEEPEPEPEEDLADKVFEPYIAMIKQLMEQVDRSKSEMRADQKFAAVNEDTQFLKKLAEKLQDLWVRLLSSTDEKTLKFSRRVIAEELQEEIDQVLDHLDYKKQRDVEAEAEAAAEAEATEAAVIAEAADEQLMEFSEPATDPTDMEISLIKVEQEKDRERGVSSDGPGDDDNDRQNQDSPTGEAITPQSTSSDSV